MVVGYCAFGFRSRRPGATSAAMKAVSARVLIAIFLFGVAANYGGMRLATAADTANALVFRTFGYFALVAFVVTLIRHATSTDRSRRAFGYLAYGVMLPVLIVSSFAVARGSRTDAAFVVLALLSVRTFFIRPARLGTLAALAVVTLFVLTPTLQALRVQALAESSSAGAVALRNPSGGVLSWSGWDLVNRRTLGGESLALAVKYSPQSLPYQHGRTWSEVAYVFVPHLLWPDKPSGNITTEFFYYLWRIERGTRRRPYAISHAPRRLLSELRSRGFAYWLLLPRGYSRRYGFRYSGRSFSRAICRPNHAPCSS